MRLLLRLGGWLSNGAGDWQYGGYALGWLAMRSVGVLVLAGLAGVLVGCEAGGGPSAGGLLLEGEQAYDAQRYTQAIASLTQYIERAEGPRARARALYVRAMSHALLGRRQMAYADLLEASQTLSDRRLIWRVHAVLGILRFEDEQWPMAAREFDKSVAAMPDMPPKDALLYRLGLCYERSGSWTQAQVQYRRILQDFPRGPYVSLARRRAELKADHFAVQCGVFSNVDAARKLTEQLQQANLKAGRRVETRGGQQLHVVVVGHYTSYAEAERMLAQVRTYIPDAQLWP
jgi:tetratricopeptide (TPR) repeat protein